MCGIGLKCDGPVQEVDRLVDLVPRDRRFRRAVEPRDGLHTDALQLGAGIGPCDVDILGPHGLGVVMCEQ